MIKELNLTKPDTSKDKKKLIELIVNGAAKKNVSMKL
jgi:hypothetical protein